VVALARHLVVPEVPASRVDAVLSDTGLSDTGLSDAADRRVGGYSRGMLQRLGLAATVVGEPALLLVLAAGGVTLAVLLTERPPGPGTLVDRLVLTGPMPLSGTVIRGDGETKESVGKEGTMQRRSAGWLLAEFSVAFVAGVVGAMVASHRRSGPVPEGHRRVDASAQLAGRELQTVG
jgi:hypothetical protein